MANHKSAKKRARQNEVRKEQNKWKTTRVRGVIKSLREAITNSDKDAATKLLNNAQSLLAKLAKSSALKKEAAARKTSRLAAQVAKL